MFDKAKTVAYAVEGLQHIASVDSVSVAEAEAALQAFGMVKTPEGVWVADPLKYGVEVIDADSEGRAFVWKVSLT